MKLNISLGMLAATVPFAILFAIIGVKRERNRMPSCVTITNIYPCDNGFRHATFLADFAVFSTDTRQPLTLLEVINRLQGMKDIAFIRVDGQLARDDRFYLEELSSPRYADRYQLSQKQWATLQDYVSKKLAEFSPTNALVHPDVYKHWLSIQAGHPPFGLRVTE